MGDLLVIGGAASLFQIVYCLFVKRGKLRAIPLLIVIGLSLLCGLFLLGNLAGAIRGEVGDVGAFISLALPPILASVAVGLLVGWGIAVLPDAWSWKPRKSKK